MSPKRRYSETEIKEIFSRASEHQRGADHGSKTGLTLSELQEIGREVGISADAVAEAAASIEPATEIAAKTYLGFPVTVARTVQLPEAPSNEEWDEIVVDLRRTFDASGEVLQEGSLRQWRNGNLKALIEPSDTGSRLRLQSFHEMARNQLIGGLVFAVMNLAFIGAVVLAGKFGVNENTVLLSLMAAGGVGVFGHAAYRLRSWVATRGKEMEGVATRALARIRSSGSPESIPESDDSTSIANSGPHPILDELDEPPEAKERMRQRDRN
ncbi:MAG: hypothetical protein KJO98_16015 [Rhodothermia bacterium]|nr:hypothetical protein [Rhodothermia bacterium]